MYWNETTAWTIYKSVFCRTATPYKLACCTRGSSRLEVNKRGSFFKGWLSPKSSTRAANDISTPAQVLEGSCFKRLLTLITVAIEACSRSWWSRSSVKKLQMLHFYSFKCLAAENTLTKLKTTLDNLVPFRSIWMRIFVRLLTQKCLEMPAWKS
jgi:hypothetical protein